MELRWSRRTKIMCYPVDVEEDDRLDELRIHQRATLRRSLYRSRSHAIVATVVCAVAAAELARQSIYYLHVHAMRWAVSCIALLIVAIFGTVMMFRRVGALHRECKTHDELPALSEPDFSTLSDGSQQWKNLHDVK